MEAFVCEIQTNPVCRWHAGWGEGMTKNSESEETTNDEEGYETGTPSVHMSLNSSEWEWVFTHRVSLWGSR